MAARGCFDSIREEGIEAARPALEVVGGVDVAAAGDATEAVDDAVEVEEIFGFKDELNKCLGTIAGFGIDAADVGAVVTDNGGHLLEHACPVVTVDHDLDRISGVATGDLV